MEPIKFALCLLQLMFLYPSVAIVADLPRVTSSRTSLRGAAMLGVKALPFGMPTSKDCSCSPYSLGFAGTTQTSSGSRHCFTVGYPGCDASRACCRALMKSVDSLALNTGTECQQPQAISKVEVNGSLWRHWDVGMQQQRQQPAELPGGSQRGVIVQLFGLAADSSTLPGTTICITTAAAAGEELCDLGSGEGRFAVVGSASASTTAAPSAAAVCPVQGLRRRARRLAAGTVTTTARPASPPIPRPVASPRLSASKPPRSPRPPPARRSSPPPPRPPPARRFSPTPTPPPPPQQPPSTPPPPPQQPPVTPPAAPSSLSGRSSAASADTSSRVCGAVTLVSPLDKSGSLTYTFGKQVSCDGMAKWMARNLTDAARVAGAQLSTPFALEGCSAVYDPAATPQVLPFATVCGSFASVAEAVKIQGLIQPLLAQWRYLLLGRAVPGGRVPYFCPPPGYGIESMVWGDEDESPVGYLKVQC